MSKTYSIILGYNQRAKVMTPQTEGRYKINAEKAQRTYSVKLWKKFPQSTDIDIQI